MFKQLLIMFFILGVSQNTCSLSAQGYVDVEKLIQVLETSTSPSAANPTLEQLNKFIDDGYLEKIPKEQKERLIIVFLKQLKNGVRVAEAGESDTANKYVKLLSNIAGKVKDERTIPILIDGLNGHYQNALAKIGGPAIKPLLNRFGDKTVAGTGNGKSAILKVLKKIGMNQIRSQDMGDVKKILNKACNDGDVYVRRAALEAFGELGDENDIPAITKIEQSDSTFFEVDVSSGVFKARKQKKFIVREEAVKTLKRIKDRAKIKS